jgi:hypothetical protein
VTRSAGRSVAWRPLAIYRAAIVGLLMFVLAVIVEHALVPGLSPLTHEISEYSNTRYGGLMVAGFVAWAISLAATAMLATRGAELNSIRLMLSALFAVASLGLLITACFHTQTSAGRLPPGAKGDLGGELHNLGSGAAMVALWVAAPLSLFTLSDRRYRTQTVTLVLLAAVITIILLAIGPQVAGLRQRCLLAVACTWQLALVAALSQDEDVGKPEEGTVLKR